jgi:hypothetical protein
MRNQFIACFTLLFVLQSCSVLTDINTQSQSVDTDLGPSNNAPTSVINAEGTLATDAGNILDIPATNATKSGQFSSDVLYMLLTAEMAASRQQFSVTLKPPVMLALLLELPDSRNILGTAGRHSTWVSFG